MSLTIVTDPTPLTINADGVVVVNETRIPLSTVVTEFKQGATAEAIAEQFPSLRLADVYVVIGYYLNHQGEVEAYLEQQRQYSQKIREENEQRFPSRGLRDRLLTRRRVQVDDID